jgi:hypothetical protein
MACRREISQETSHKRRSLGRSRIANKTTRPSQLDKTPVSSVLRTAETPGNRRPTLPLAITTILPVAASIFLANSSIRLLRLVPLPASRRDLHCSLVAYSQGSIRFSSSLMFST